MLTRYWIQYCEEKWPAISISCRAGVGVTAFDLRDAMSLLVAAGLLKDEKVTPSNIIENVDVSELDYHHVLPNMKAPNIRGIWFPLY